MTMKASDLIEQRLSGTKSLNEGELDSLIDGFDKAREQLEDLVWNLQDLSRKVKAYDSRISSNMNAYMIPHLETWVSQNSHGGGDTIPDIIRELEKMRDDED